MTFVLLYTFRLSVLFKFYVSGILPYVSTSGFPELDIVFLLNKQSVLIARCQITS